MTSFSGMLAAHGLPPLTRETPSWLQINLGKRCNQACSHCHVDASPVRTEMMDAPTADAVIQLLANNPSLELFDITGGAPELNPHFRRMVSAAREMKRRVIDRCNLTILSEPGQDDLAAFLAHHQVEVVASLPCYSEANVDKQRGRGVFTRSIEGLRELNALGYGRDPALKLDLVYNPVGPHLPPAQAGLQQDYTLRLADDFGVVFNDLITITNLPIARFLNDLTRNGRLEAYQELLVSSFNPATVDGLMCRHLISVSWDGRLFDCDFNQMLDLASPGPTTIHDLLQTDDRAGAPIVVGSHCLGCTAGAGSSCGGALA